MKQRTGPLNGIRIVDMTSVIMGPFATQILADYGADVIKIESAEGDLMRLAGVMQNPRMGSLFLQNNRNKRSIVLDLKSRPGRDAVLRLVETADVFVTNIRPSAIARLGLSYADLCKVNPEVVYASLVGYGQDGPYAGRPAYDDLIQGISGIPAITARANNSEPRYIPLTMADKISGMAGVNAILAAMMHKERNGEGQEIEVPMFEVMAQFVLSDHIGGSGFDPSNGPTGYNRLLEPDRRPYRTSDGYLSVLVYTNQHWRAFFDIIGQPETFQETPIYNDHAVRAQHYDLVYNFLSAQLLLRTSAEWMVQLAKHDVPFAPMNSLDDLLADPHLNSVELFQPMDHPTEGRIRTIRNPVRMERTPPSIYSHPPTLGEHSAEILSEAGFSLEEIAELNVPTQVFDPTV